MVICRIALCFVLCFLVGRPTLAQSVSVSPTASTDVERLDALLKRMSGYLDSLANYEVIIEQNWELDGDRRAEGSHRFRLIWHSPGKFRLDVKSGAEAGSRLQVAGDGTTYQCLLEFDEMACFSEHSGELQQILDDPFLYSNLRYSGLDLTLRPNMRSYVMSLVKEVRFMGSESLQGNGTDHYRLEWAIDQTSVDLWIATGDQPLLMKAKFVHRTKTPDDVSHTIDSTANLRWNLKPDLCPESTRLTIPEDAVKTPDVYSYLLDGRSQSMLGKACPRLTLQTLDGQPWSMDEQAGQSVLALVFWSSQAAPSIPATDSIREFMRDFESRGVTFYLIDVGETPDVVRMFESSRKVEHPIVLDPKFEASKAFGVTALPTTIIIGKDGRIQSAHVGYNPDIIEIIGQDLGKLLAGETLVKPIQQP